MTRFKVLKDPSNTNNFTSTSVIVSNLNQSAKKLDLYDEDGVQVMYDCLLDDKGQHVDAFICPYEVNFPSLLTQRASGRPILGVSKDNLSFIKNSYHIGKSNYFCLGCDENIWFPKEKREFKDKFVFALIGESNSRGSYELIIPAFCENFENQKGVMLYIRDRAADSKFRVWIDELAKQHNVEIVYDDRWIEDHSIENDIFSFCDCHLYLNKSSTWALPCIQGLMAGVLTIGIAYSGPREYLTDYSSLPVNFSLIQPTDFDISYLASLGIRNHLLSFYPYWYKAPPVWAIPDINHLKQLMNQVVEIKDWSQLKGGGEKNSRNLFLGKKRD